MVVLMIFLIWMISPNWSFTVFMIAALIGYVNFFKFNNNFVILLLMLELLGMTTMIFWSVNLSLTMMGPIIIFFLMVTMVAEATLSLSILISLARVKSNEMEMTSLLI